MRRQHDPSAGSRLASRAPRGEERRSADGMTPNGSFDAIVVGSGAAGLSAALTTARAGLRTIVLERTEAIGGAAAVSRGVGLAPPPPPAPARRRGAGRSGRGGHPRGAPPRP